MGQVLHGSARTTEAVRRAIQRSEESVRALAKRHGISPTTVQKWRKRASVRDAPMGPKAIHSTVLTTEEEAMIVAFRRDQLRQHLQLFIDAYNHGRRLKTLRGLTPYE
jgi:transposase-like protein